MHTNKLKRLFNKGFKMTFYFKYIYTSLLINMREQEKFKQQGSIEKFTVTGRLQKIVYLTITKKR